MKKWIICFYVLMLIGAGFLFFHRRHRPVDCCGSDTCVKQHHHEM